MHHILIQYINSRLGTSLSAKEEDLIREAFVLRKLRRHQYLLQEGEVCKFAGFVVKGALKQYTVDETGKEDILGLYIENWWVGDRESFFNGTPTPYFIDAFEDAEILLANKESFSDKLNNQPFIAQLKALLTERNSLQLLRRLQSTKTLSAELRLVDLEKNYPEFLQRFPQHIIASYLGMTKETLSRIRSNSAKKQQS